MRRTQNITVLNVLKIGEQIPLPKNPLNNTVDNWAVEIESFKINFIHIPAKDNILADTLSRLIDIDPDVVQEPELKDYKFGVMHSKHFTRLKVPQWKKLWPWWMV